MSKWLLYDAWGNLVSWSSYEQKAVSRSLTEVEYHALASRSAKVTWITTLLGELELSLKQLPRLMCDNINAQHITKNSVQHTRTKYIEIDFHFICDMVLKKNLHLGYFNTNE